MSEHDNQPQVAGEASIDLLIERVGSWYKKLLETRDDIEEVMSHPATAVFLSDKEVAYARTRYRGRAIEPGTKFPTVLEDCATQEEVAEYLAALNDGIADLVEVTRLIRRLGLSNAATDRAVRKNLATRLVKTGRWVKIATWRYRSIHWKPPVCVATPSEKGNESREGQESHGLSTSTWPTQGAPRPNEDRSKPGS